MDQDLLIVVLLVLGVAIIAAVAYYLLKGRKSGATDRPFDVPPEAQRESLAARHEPASDEPEALTFPHPPEVSPSSRATEDQESRRSTAEPEAYEHRGSPTAADGKVDPNTASKEELAELPGCGEALAERIVAHRERHGRFRSAEELTQVEGVGEKTVEQLEPHLRFPDDSD